MKKIFKFSVLIIMVMCVTMGCEKENSKTEIESKIHFHGLVKDENGYYINGVNIALGIGCGGEGTEYDFFNYGVLRTTTTGGNNYKYYNNEGTRTYGYYYYKEELGNYNYAFYSINTDISAYSKPNYPPPFYYLEVSKPGYETKRTNIIVQTGKEARIDIIIKEIVD